MKILYVTNISKRITLKILLSLCILQIAHSLPAATLFHGITYPRTYLQYMRRITAESPDDTYGEVIKQIFNRRKDTPKGGLMILCNFEPTRQECQLLPKTTIGANIKTQIDRPELVRILPNETDFSFYPVKPLAPATYEAGRDPTVIKTDDYIPFFPNMSAYNGFYYAAIMPDINIPPNNVENEQPNFDSINVRNEPEDYVVNDFDKNYEECDEEGGDYNNE